MTSHSDLFDLPTAGPARKPASLSKHTDERTQSVRLAELGQRHLQQPQLRSEQAAQICGIAADGVASQPYMSELRFSRLFKQSPLPMCCTSESDGFSSTQWNMAWFDAFGSDPLTAQGKSGLALGIWLDTEKRSTMLARSLNGLGGNGIEVRMRKANGELRWMSLSTRIFMEPEGALVLVSFFDVTDVRDAQHKILELNSELEARVAQRTTELQTANAELSPALEALGITKDQLVQSEKLAALGALVAGVVHELNTPIGNGLTMASSLEDKVRKFRELMTVGLRRSDLHAFVDDAQVTASILVRNLDRARALITSFKQVSVDQTSMQKRRFALSALVSEVSITVIPSVDKRACSVINQIEEELWMDSYPGALGKVFTNLIKNALVHSFDSQTPGHVTIRAWATGSHQIVAEVRDNGRGIHQDNLHRVFEPFFATHMGQGGSGLGLHIVHHLVMGLLGGAVELQSSPGQGASFVLRLPTNAPLARHCHEITDRRAAWTRAAIPKKSRARQTNICGWQRYLTTRFWNPAMSQTLTCWQNWQPKCATRPMLLSRSWTPSGFGIRLAMAATSPKRRGTRTIAHGPYWKMKSCMYRI